MFSNFIMLILQDHVFEINLPADIKGFLSDVKPALISALDAEYEKNPFEVCCVSVTVWKIVLFVISIFIDTKLVQFIGCRCCSEENSKSYGYFIFYICWPIRWAATGRH